MFVNALKFLIFVLLLPLILVSTKVFFIELKTIPGELYRAFHYGIFVYLLFHFFIHEARGVYQFGQKLVGSLCQFFEPIVRFASVSFPLLTVLILIGYYFANLMFKGFAYNDILMFLVSFTLSLHMIFAAKELREGESNVAKPEYFFAMSVIYVVNIFFIALLFGLIVPKFSFPHFFNMLTQESSALYSFCWQRLF